MRTQQEQEQKQEQEQEQEQEQRQNLQHVVVWVALQVCCCDSYSPRYIMSNYR